MRLTKRRARRAVAPILAEILLIGITLVLGASLSGYVFGLMNTYSHPAEVSATGASCASSAGGVTCRITLSNTGTENVETASVCTMSLAGGKVTGTLNNAVITAGGTPQTVQCSTPTGGLAQGASVVGTVALSNGAEAYFVAPGV